MHVTLQLYTIACARMYFLCLMNASGAHDCVYLVRCECIAGKSCAAHCWCVHVCVRVCVLLCFFFFHFTFYFKSASLFECRRKAIFAFLTIVIVCYRNRSSSASINVNVRDWIKAVNVPHLRIHPYKRIVWSHEFVIHIHDSSWFIRNDVFDHSVQYDRALCTSRNTHFVASIESGIVRIFYFRENWIEKNFSAHFRIKKLIR